MGNIEFIANQSPRIITNLTKDSQPLWGQLSAHQMVEHLSLRLAFSSKKIIGKPFMTPERMAYYKAKFFNKDAPIPKNFTAKGLIIEKPNRTRFRSLDDAIAVYQESILDFVTFFQKDISGLSFHPFFGYLSYDEWVYYHNKHIKHHFIQFGLIEVEGTKRKRRLLSY